MPKIKSAKVEEELVDEPFTPEEVRKLLAGLNTAKSPM